jgi:hypothetical protein
MADHVTCFNRLTIGLDVDRGPKDLSWGGAVPDQGRAMPEDGAT